MTNTQDKVIYLQASDVVETFTDETVRPNPYATGYGRKIPTPYRLKLTDGRVRRVYVVCYSNVGTAYVLVKGAVRVLSTDVEYMLRG